MSIAFVGLAARGQCDANMVGVLDIGKNSLDLGLRGIHVCPAFGQYIRSWLAGVGLLGETV